jgi:DNA-directed RNA polymerase specialized sigma24 family protein
VQGYTQAEAAETLQLPLGTIKSRGRRIIRTLARHIN